MRTAMLSAFGDESHDSTKKRIFTVAGLLGDESQWASFRQAWNARLGGAVDLRALVEKIAVSPEAKPGTVEDIRQLVSQLGYTIPVEESSFTQYPHVVTDLAEIIRFSSK